MYFKDNLGNISIDETAFSNGELYTIVTNKDDHGKRGTVIAMIKETKADDICRYLMKSPESKRRMVKNVTLDMGRQYETDSQEIFSLRHTDHRPLSCTNADAGSVAGAVYNIAGRL